MGVFRTIPAKQVSTTALNEKWKKIFNSSARRIQGATNLTPPEAQNQGLHAAAPLGLLLRSPLRIPPLLLEKMMQVVLAWGKNGWFVSPFLVRSQKFPAIWNENMGANVMSAAKPTTEILEFSWCIFGSKHVLFLGIFDLLSQINVTSPFKKHVFHYSPTTGCFIENSHGWHRTLLQL